MVPPMKAKISAPVMWITLPPHPRKKNNRMKFKEVILCTLMIAASCAAIYTLSSSLIAKEEKLTTLSPMETKFIQEAAGAGMAEMKLAELGGRKAESRETKAFAMMITRDHGVAHTELNELAVKKGVTLPGEMDAGKVDTLKKLEAAEGKAFDRMFLTEMVKCHGMDIKNFQTAAKEAKDQDLKMFVGKTLPTLVAHHEAALKLAKH